MPASPQPFFAPPPPKLRPALPLWAFGLEGPWLGRHLAETLDDLTATSPALSGLRAAMAAWRFERAPLDPTCARAVLAAGREAVAPELRALARHLAPRLGPPAEARNWPARRDGPDREAALATLDRGMADGAHGLFWRGKAFEYALTAGLPDLAERVAASLADDPATAPLAARLAAESAAAFAAPADALAAAQAVDATLFPRFAALAMAYAYSASNREQEATTTLLQLWRRENWHPGLTLRLDERLFPTPPARLEAWAGRLTVCVYSWNRAARLERTLASLAASRLGPARLLVLDNGSTDDTAAVCRAAAERFAPGRFHSLSLPTNIGAPAARNWLAALAADRPESLVAFVDDDVTLPENWLAALAGTLAADPEADAAGARIYAGATGVPVSADVHLLPPQGDRSVRPLVNCPRGPDFGLTAVSRSCPSVSGCCHLLRGRALRGGAPFDIRFSPSQFDDLARDLRSFLAGGHCRLCGDLAVAHHQPGPAGQTSARTLGARIKLDGLFPAPGMEVAAERDLDTAWEELHAAWTRLVRFSRACTAADPPACR